MRIFSFKHQMSLVRNASLFTDRVSRAPISGNIDNPEGGLDALMQVRSPLLATAVSPAQVMVCGERIGWRKEARRVIIYTSDQVIGYDIFCYTNSHNENHSIVKRSFINMGKYNLLKK